MDLHGEIMNLPTTIPSELDKAANLIEAYKMGHRDARHAAAELAVKPHPAQQELAQMKATLRNLLETSLGSQGHRQDNGADYYQCPVCSARTETMGYADIMGAPIDYVEHKEDCRLVALYRAVADKPAQDIWLEQAEIEAFALLDRSRISHNSV